MYFVVYTDVAYIILPQPIVHIVHDNNVPQHSDPGCMGWTVDFSSRHYVGSAMAYYAKRGTGGGRVEG